MQRFQGSASEESAVAKARVVVEQLLSTVDVHVGTVRLVLNGTSAEELSITFDGGAIPASGLSVPLRANPGPHTVDVKAGDTRPRTFHVDVKEGQNVDLVIDRADTPKVAIPVAARPDPGAPETPRSVRLTSEISSQDRAEPSGSHLKPWVLGAEGAAALAGIAVGIGSTIALQSTNQRIHTRDGQIDTLGGACKVPSAAGACGELQIARSDHDSQRTLAIAGFAFWGLGVAALVTIWVVWPSSKSQAAITIPFIVVGGGGVHLKRTF